MREHGFYHLTRSTLADALARLLARTLERGERALVLGADPDRLAALDAALWEHPSIVWLPHGTAADGDAAWQPIWLATDPALAAKPPNEARFLFLTDGVNAHPAETITRIFDLFDGADAASVEAARTRYTQAKTVPVTLTYWKQGSQGWEKG